MIERVETRSPATATARGGLTEKRSRQAEQGGISVGMKVGDHMWGPVG